MTTTYTTALSFLDQWYPGMGKTLIEVNAALRNINRGKMDFLPYTQPTENFTWYMEAVLTPQGENNPPAIGHWQLRLRATDDTFDIVLQGKSQEGNERGLIIFRAPSPEREAALTSNQKASAENVL
ncbi:hypothetical protein [Sulfobacillus sp. hq2]|uniref:hypothetical protein n=1 Tax=Sulfobacillus TaxID=28033 RepID=UPI001A9A4654|nr:hypothetical protein [Sulfobacillus sp. hq2]